MQDLTQIRVPNPDLRPMIEADLPDECALSSDALGSITSAVPTSASKWKCESDIADVIRDFSNWARRSELTNSKQKLFFMEKEDKRHDHKSAFNQWEKIHAQLRSRCEDVKNSNDDEIKAEHEDDIKVLVQRKKQLALQLGFN